MNLKCEGYCALHLKFFQNLICCKADKPAGSGESFKPKVTTFCKYAISQGEIYIFLLQMSCFSLLYAPPEDGFRSDLSSRFLHKTAAGGVGHAFRRNEKNGKTEEDHRIFVGTDEKATSIRLRRSRQGGNKKARALYLYKRRLWKTFDHISTRGLRRRAWKSSITPPHWHEPKM